MGRVLVAAIVALAIGAGGLLYYLQVYAYYQPVDAAQLQAVRLTGLESQAPEEIVWDQLEAIAGQDNPLRYRACFRTPLSLAMLTETYVMASAAVPLQGPDWFTCFDARQIGADLEAGQALAFLGQENITYGVDRLVAIYDDGRGFVWHQLNACGEAFYSGDPVPDTCPPIPQQGESNG